MEGEFPMEEINFASFVELWLPVTMFAAMDPEHVALEIEVWPYGCVPHASRIFPLMCRGAPVSLTVDVPVDLVNRSTLRQGRTATKIVSEPRDFF